MRAQPIKASRQIALRFARVVRYRDDKSAAEADTIEMVREHLTG